MEGSTVISAGGLQTSIIVDDVKVAHYGVQVEDQNGKGKATSWIASEVDKEFAINVSVESLPKANAYGVLIYIDGLLVSSSFFCANSETRSRIITGVRVSQTEKRKFVFGALEFLEDDADVDGAPSKTPGQIGIMLQTSKSPAIRRSPDAPGQFVLPSSDKVHEGTSKGLAHQVKYTEPQEDRLATPKKIFNLQKPFTIAKHTIKYRSLAILQASGVVPLPQHPATGTSSVTPSSSESPAPSAHPRKRKLARVKAEVKAEVKEEGDADSEERIRKRRRELMAELAKLEEDEDRLRASARAGKLVKQEIKNEPQAVIRSKEVIDLTI